MTTKVAVLGAGNAGYATTADLVRRGFDVTLFSHVREKLDPISDRGGIEISGVVGDSFVRFENVTTDLEHCVVGAEYIVLAVPQTAHEFYAKALSSYLKENQVVVLNPGHTCGGMHFATTLRRSGYRGTARLGEFHTMSFSARIRNPGQVFVAHITKNLLFSTFPGKLQDPLYPGVQNLFPNVVKAKNVLDSALRNINAIEHPAQIVLNAGWVEHTKGDYYFYYEGTTPSVGRVIDLVDKERMRIAEALRIDTSPFVEILYEAGYTAKEACEVGTAHTAFQKSPEHRWSKGPKSLDHRYMHEDVGYGLVGMANLARFAGVKTPLMDALIALASALNGIDYMLQGLTLEKMGLEGKKREELKEFLFEGYH